MRHCVVLLGLLVPQIAFSDDDAIEVSAKAKDQAQILKARPSTIYCECPFTKAVVDVAKCSFKPNKNKKTPSGAYKLHWEHVVPVATIGKTFPEWKGCAKNGAKAFGKPCAAKNPLFIQMTKDRHNLWPETAGLNAARKDFPIAYLGGSTGQYGPCEVEIKNKHFEPPNSAKGVVARVYKYMDAAYPGRGLIPPVSAALFDAWDAAFPPEKWECDRAALVKKLGGRTNEVVAAACKR